MDSTPGNLLLLLTGGTQLKTRLQHPQVLERKDRGSYYWFFRYRLDEIQPDGSVKTTRPFHRLGPSRGKGAVSYKNACIERDRFLAGINGKAIDQQPSAVPGAPEQPLAIDPGDIIFGPLAELWQRDYVEKTVAGKYPLAKPTREGYAWALAHVLPRWKDVRLKDIHAKDVLDWLQGECTSWWGMASLRNAMSGVIAKAIEWEILPETFANPIHRVRLPKRWLVREKRIHTPEDSARILALLDEPNLLICETCLDTGTRISEVTGLMIKHVDLENGTINIRQRNWRGDIDDPKTNNSKRTLALGALTARYRAWIAGLKRKGPNDWVFPQVDDLKQPRWDSGVRQALKKAAMSIKQSDDKDDPGLDFPGFGPHSLRRANITWRQEVGGSAIEASRIAGHSSTAITDEYTLVGFKRQDELTRRIQEKRAKAARRTAVSHDGVSVFPRSADMLSGAE